jgi:protein phosphatase
VAVGHVGDSRLYRLRDGDLERLTQDHSLVEEFVRQGKLTPEEAEVHPQRSIITRALGPEADVEVDTYTHPGRDGDVYLICSDGLTGMVSEDVVAQILTERESLEDAAGKLIEAANENGGKDNITVVLFRLESDGEEEQPEDTLGGQATKVGVSADTVRAAVAEAEKAETTRQYEVVPEEDEEKTEEDEEKTERAEGGVPVTSPLARRRRPVSAVRRRRARVTGALVLLALVAVVVGLYVGSRQFWFVGTDHGQVALFRGLPYDLPLGISLYSREYTSSVPARAITNRRQRDHDLNQQLRSHGDAVDLVRTLERTYSPSR